MYRGGRGVVIVVRGKHTQGKLVYDLTCLDMKSEHKYPYGYGEREGGRGGDKGGDPAQASSAMM